MSSRQKLIDAVTLRQILIERYSRGEAKSLSKVLTKMDKAIAKIVGSKFGKTRSIFLSRQVEKLAQSFLRDYSDDMLKGLESFTLKEAKYAEDLLAKSTAASVIKRAPIPALKKAVRKRPMELLIDGNIKKVTIEQAVKQFSKNQSKRIGQIIKDGANSGVTTPQMVKEIREIVKTRTKTQAAALVRTTTNHMSTVAMEEAFSGNDELLEGWQWVAVLDSRTSLTCAGLDGKRFELKSDQSKPPIHWGCRSRWIPRVKPEFDLGSEVGGERAAMNGAQPANTTYGGWLGRQDKGVQNEVLGSTRAKLFRSGKLSISKFTDRKGNVLTLDQLAQRNSL
tara:strand:- start:678 stop:1688 length:1011 start_codon:yes stop_codon:yes gene_type:complete